MDIAFRVGGTPAPKYRKNISTVLHSIDNNPSKTQTRARSRAAAKPSTSPTRVRDRRSNFRHVSLWHQELTYGLKTLDGPQICRLDPDPAKIDRCASRGGHSGPEILVPGDTYRELRHFIRAFLRSVQFIVTAARPQFGCTEIQ